MQPQTTATSLLSRVRDPADTAAWREFDERYRKLLLRFCWRQGLSRTDADDIVQRVFTNLARTLPDFVYDRNRGRFRDYLYRCLKNAIVQWLNRPERQNRELDSGVEARIVGAVSDGSPCDAAWDEEWVAHHYRTALGEIRRTFDARSIDLFERMMRGAATAELAREFEMTEAAVCKVRQRVRERMKDLIAQQIREEDEV